MIVMAFFKRIRVILLKKLFVILLLTNVEAQTIPSNIIKLGSSLSPNFTCTSRNDDSRSSCWFSDSGLFAFGFYRQGDGFAVGTWIVDQTTIVWTTERDSPPLSSMATLELTEEGLSLKDDRNRTQVIADAWTTSAALLDSGNFVLYLNRSINWQSFDFPTDTILGGQNLSVELVSSVSTTDHSSGKFSLDINLGLFPVNFSEAYWVPVPPGRIYGQLSLNVEGSLFLTGSSEYEDIILANGSSYGSVTYRATLDADGVLRLYSHHYHNVSLKNNSTTNVVVEWSAPDNKCRVNGFCGLNSYCEVQREKADCYCYPGHAFINSINRSNGCHREFADDGCLTETGSRETASSSVTSSYNITAFENMSWSDVGAYSDVLKEKEACSNSCLDDCNCWAALHTDAHNRCRKYKLPLMYGKRGSFISATAFLKTIHLVKSTKARGVLAPDPNGFRESTILIVLGSSLGSIAFLCSLLAISGFLFHKQRVHRYNKLLMENSKLGFGVDFGLHVFSYNELEKATEGFNEELGRGLFGAVYKGSLLYGGQNKAIAVKRLENFVEEGVREFRAEMSAIGMTHHRNLVQLLGFCIEDSKMLLVYEFMSNGSLADLLRRDTNQPSWKDRVRYIQDAAKGVLYLHEGCAVHIIHGNLRSQNILLDESWTAKISDFGFARLLSIPSQVKTPSQERASYSAPEWQKNGVISAKADVFSFGVVLLETICCLKRNMDLMGSEDEEAFLPRRVYNIYEGGDLLKLVEGEKNVDVRTLERLVRVGLWCTQDSPDLRPMMKSVILMLEGTVDVPSPLLAT